MRNGDLIYDWYIDSAEVIWVPGNYIVKYIVPILHDKKSKQKKLL